MRAKSVVLCESNFSVRLLLCAFPERERDLSARGLSTRTCVAMVEKFPEYAVYSAKIVFDWPLVNATKAYMSGIVLFVCGLGARVCVLMRT
jgi:hypothetical protein